MGRETECTGGSHASSVIVEPSKKGHAKRRIISRFVQDSETKRCSVTFVTFVEENKGSRVMP